jgi:opacity protein-like surface antigen
MLTENEGTIPLLWETSEEKQTEHKKRILGVPVVILAAIASLAMIFYVGIYLAMNSTPVGVSSTNYMIAGRGMYTILGWQSGWRVILVDNFGVEYGFHEGSSMWDPVAHDFGYCYGRNNVTGTKMKYEYQVDSTDGTPGDFLINEVPYKLSPNGTMFLF